MGGADLQGAPGSRARALAGALAPPQGARGTAEGRGRLCPEEGCLSRTDLPFADSRSCVLRAPALAPHLCSCPERSQGTSEFAFL